MHELLYTLSGRAIQHLRGERSQRDIARRAHVPAGTWCQWERGQRLPQAAQIPKILTGLECTHEALEAAVLACATRELEQRGVELVATSIRQLPAFHTLIESLTGGVQLRVRAFESLGTIAITLTAQQEVYE